VLQISLLSFRTQFIVAGPGLVPWMSDTAFLAGMTDYLGSNSGVGNLTIRNWAEVNLANFPVSLIPPASRLPVPAGQPHACNASTPGLLMTLHMVWRAVDDKIFCYVVLCRQACKMHGKHVRS